MANSVYQQGRPFSFFGLELDYICGYVSPPFFPSECSFIFFPAQHFLVNWNKEEKKKEKKMESVADGQSWKKREFFFRKLISFYAFLLFLSLSLPGTLGFLLVVSSCDGTRAVSKRSSESYNLAGGKSTRPNAVYLYTLTVAKPARQRFLYLLNKKKKNKKKYRRRCGTISHRSDS